MVGLRLPGLTHRPCPSETQVAQILQDRLRLTPIQSAIQTADASAVKKLLEDGVDANYTLGVDGSGPYHHIALVGSRSEYEGGAVEIIGELHKHG